MDLQRVQHSPSGHDDLLRLFLHREGPNEGSHLLCCLPFGQLGQTLLACPHRGVNDLQEQLSSSRVEDEDRPVHRFCGQVAFEGLVDRHTVHIGIVNEPDGLCREELLVVLRVQVGLRWLRRVQLESLSDSLPHHVQRRVGLHDLVHRPRQQRLDPGEPIPVPTVEVVREVQTQQHTCRGGVDGHVVRRVVQKLSSAVPLDVVRVVIPPPQLDVQPVLLRCGAIEDVSGLRKEGGLRDPPLVRSKQQNVCAGRIHLVRLPRMDGLLLHHLDLQSVQLEVKHLAEIHDDGLVDLLPEMGPEDLDQRDLQCRNLPVHEDARQVQLHLEAHVHVGSVDCGGPPEGEPTVGDLVEP
mmetsp:Transcript_569/g.1265  ORF Transcript_569/g.1265 Transcript_569/m.1265 type:complete len:352 (-) Transcript_569:2863-3918(-)